VDGDFKMPSRIKLAKQRRVIALLMLELLKLPTQMHLGTGNYGSKCDDVLLMCAILIGQIEKRPMTAGKLADYAGLPRPTVVRKLREFERAGMVEMVNGAAVGVIDHLNPNGIEDTIESLIRSIKRAAVELSKMDSTSIARDVMRK
jgi:DNA-binding transcriptional ArsR family regulator